MNEHVRSVRIILYMVIASLGLLILVALAVIDLSDPSVFKLRNTAQSSDAVQSNSAVNVVAVNSTPPDIWIAPDSLDIPGTPEGDMIRYGRDLIAHTAVYLGPKGKVKAITNGMNCQNCHLKAGTKPFGNNYAAVKATYPKFRARSGSVESVEKRVNDCIERSLNGQKLHESSREMKSIVAYILWVGKNVPKDVVPKGTGLWDVKPITRPADPVRGSEVYKTHCERCHGIQGKGVMAETGLEWKYPPLQGDSSYNIGAGLFRLSRFAGYVKANMPFGISYENPVLTDEESWDVAAYINSLPRPTKDISRDWPDISKKPFDHPFGPYADNFTEQQHKYGPFEPIREKLKEIAARSKIVNR
jgi:thiosulfate dehydrogenase